MELRNMDGTFLTTYSDACGEEETILYNDGNSLQMTVRGVTFTGRSLDDFSPVAGTEEEASASFTLNRYCENAADLCGCILHCHIPLPVVTPDGTIECMLAVRLELGLPTARGFLDREVLTLSLTVGGRAYPSSGQSGWFEDELLDLQRMLPKGVFIKSCINCAFSDYSVYGHGLYGGMMCFRGQKQGYLGVHTKSEYMRIMGHYTQIVQETYLCF